MNPKFQLADGSYWVYGYDSLGQVTNAVKHWADKTLVAGQQFDYAFDTIGNRTQTQSGGDTNGTNLRVANYTNNNLNQITSRDVPPYVDVLGASILTNAVTVNGTTAYRKEEYFRQQLGVNNTNSALWTNIIVAGGINVTGNLLVAQTPQTFIYDADGNLLMDGLWTNVWDAENRMISCTTLTNVPSAGRIKEDWGYLPDGRWSQRIISTWNGSAYVPQSTNHFAWDGKLLMAILDQTNGLVMSFLRGLDLSGTMQDAGGVGGLLAVSFRTNGTHFAAYDGNGNVMALVNAADGTGSANYDYGAFGEPLRITGSVGLLNPIRFSTQFADDVTGLIKYFYRPYNPSTGTWPNRDPLGELGFELLRRRMGRVRSLDGNLYGFVNNTPVNAFDLLGLDSVAVYDGCDKGNSEGRKFGIFKHCYFSREANGDDFKRVADSFDHKIDICSLDEPKFKSLIEALKKLKDSGVEITSVAFIDHGAPGIQMFGDDEFHDPPMPDYDYSGLGVLLTPDGKISFYGCQVGKGKKGAEYLQSMANYFGRKVEAQTGNLKCNRHYKNACCRGGDIVTKEPENEN